MVRDTLGFSGLPPARIIGSTERLWLRSPEVALGLLSPGDGELPRYWKCNRRRGAWRETAMLKDPYLFQDSDRRERQRLAAIEVVTYKPESRLGWRENHEGACRLRKLYPEKKFTVAAARARVFSRCFARSMELEKIDAESRRITWSWLEGTQIAVASAEPELVLKLLEPADSPPIDSLTGQLPPMGPAEIAAQLRHRLRGHMSWVPLVAPDSLSRLRVLNEVARILRARLARLEPTGRPRVVHGDLRRRNVLIDAAGRPRLLDADHLALGDLEWDLAAWAADVSGSSRESVHAATEEFVKLEGVDRVRLELYAEVWRALLDLAEIEQRVQA